MTNSTVKILMLSLVLLGMIVVERVAHDGNKHHVDSDSPGPDGLHLRELRYHKRGKIWYHNNPYGGGGYNGGGKKKKKKKKRNHRGGSSSSKSSKRSKGSSKSKGSKGHK